MSPLFYSELNDKNNRLDLYNLVVHHPDATFFAKYEGEDIPDLLIFNQDILLIDRSIKPTVKSTVIFIEEGDFKIEKFTNKKKENMSSKKNQQIEIWGVITYIIHKN